MRVPILLIVAALLVTLSTISAQATPPQITSSQTRDEATDRIATAEMARQKIPGTASAAACDNRIVNAKGFGMLRLSATPSEGKLTVKTPGMTGDLLPLEPIASYCFRGMTVTVCFSGEFAFWNGRVYRKQ